jgi:diacylglycerol kinase family enzyme
LTDQHRQSNPTPSIFHEPIIPGILCNPASGRIKHQPQAIRQALKAITVNNYLEAVTSTEIRESIRRFSASGINLLIMAGGDGTVHSALTHLFLLWRGELPAVAVIPCGTTNMTALDLGMRKKPLAGITLLRTGMARPGTLRYALRPVLCIDQGPLRRQFGMFFGCGLIPHGVKYFHNKVRQLGVTNEFAGGFVMLGYLCGLLLRPGSSPAVHLTLRGAGGDIEKQHCLVAFATTLDRLLLGIRPYRNLEKGSLFFTIIDNNMKSVWSAVISLLAGNGGRAAGGNYGGNSDRLELLFDGDFIVDGELYHAQRENGPVAISRTAPLRFLVL